MTQLTNRYYEVAFEKKSKKMEEEKGTTTARASTEVSRGCT